MTYSYTQTHTFTILHARQITSKIATDLRQLSVFYDLVPKSMISDFAEEASILMNEGALESVEYGFKRNGVVFFSLRYEARNGSLETDDNPGRIPTDLNTDGAIWYTFLRFSRKFNQSSLEEQNRIEALLPIKRTAANEPSVGFWSYWEEERVYSAGGRSVARKRLKSLL